MKIADLFAEIGFKFDTMKLKEATKLIGDLNISSIISTGAVAALGEKIKDLLIQSSATASALTTLNKATGLPTDYIQRLEKFSHAMGSTKEEADGLITSLSQIKLKIAQTGEGALPFQIAGINPNQSIEGIIQDLNKFISNPESLKKWAARAGMSTSANQDEMVAAFMSSLGAGMGVSPSMLKTLGSKDFTKEMNASTSSFITKTPDQIKEANEVSKQFVIASENLQTSFETLASTVLPEITALIKEFNESEGIKTLGDAAKTLLRAVEILGLAGQWLKIGAMNFNNALQQPLIGASKFGNEVRKVLHMNNSIQVTVHSNTPEEFVRNFDPVWKKYINRADIQFQQST